MPAFCIRNSESNFIKPATLRCMSSLELRPFMSGSHAFADLSMNGFSKRMSSGKYLRGLFS